MIDIAANVAQYLGDRSPVERASSFDYCFNYFQRFRDWPPAGQDSDAVDTDAVHRCAHAGRLPPQAVPPLRTPRMDTRTRPRSRYKIRSCETRSQGNPVATGQAQA